MSGGLKNDAPVQSFILVEGASSAGTVVKMYTTEGYAALTAASSDEPIGFTYVASIQHPHTSFDDPTILTGQSIGIHALIPGVKAELVLPDTHAAITVGQDITMTADGMVVGRPGTGSQPCWVIGKSMEAIDQNTGGVVTVRIDKHYSSTVGA